MLILGLDLSFKGTGWCLWDQERGYVESGVRVLRDPKDKKYILHGQVFFEYSLWLMDRLKLDRINVVAVESPHFRGQAATIQCVGLYAATLGTVFAASRFYDWVSPDVIPVRPNDVKKFATGFSNADKSFMKQMAEPIIGRCCITDDEADAVHVARWAMQGMGRL